MSSHEFICPNTVTPCNVYFGKDPNRKCPLCNGFHKPIAEIVNPPDTVKFFCSYCQKEYSGRDYHRKCTCGAKCPITTPLTRRPYRTIASQNSGKRIYFKANVEVPYAVTRVKERLNSLTGLKFGYAPHITIFNFETNITWIEMEKLSNMFTTWFGDVKYVEVIGAEIFGQSSRRYLGLNMGFEHMTSLRDGLVRMVIGYLGFKIGDYESVNVNGVRHQKFSRGDEYVSFAYYNASDAEFEAHVTVTEVTGYEYLLTNEIKNELPMFHNLEITDLQISESPATRK
jgi:hypothetical protein